MDLFQVLRTKVYSLQLRLTRLAEGDANAGSWITVNGRHVFIPEGTSKEDAIKRSLEADKKNPWPRNAEGKRELPGPGFKIPSPPTSPQLAIGKAPHGLVTDLLKRFPNREALMSHLNTLSNQKLQTALKAIKIGTDKDTKYIREVIREALKS